MKKGPPSSGRSRDPMPRRAVRNCHRVAWPCANKPCMLCCRPRAMLGAHGLVDAHEGTPPLSCCQAYNFIYLVFKIYYRIVTDNFIVKTNFPPNIYWNSETNFRHQTKPPIFVIFYHDFVTKILWQFANILPLYVVTKNFVDNLLSFCHRIN